MVRRISNHALSLYEYIFPHEQYRLGKVVDGRGIFFSFSCRTQSLDESYDGSTLMENCYDGSTVANTLEYFEAFSLFSGAVACANLPRTHPMIQPWRWHHCLSHCSSTHQVSKNQRHGRRSADYPQRQWYAYFSYFHPTENVIESRGVWGVWLWCGWIIMMGVLGEISR